MKKLIYGILLVCLVGCSSKETTTVCKIDQESIKITNTIVSEEDKVATQTLKNELNFVSLGLTKDEISSLADSYEEAYNVDGVDYSFEVGEEVLTETIKIDYDVVSVDTLIELGLIESQENVTYVSLQKTVETLQASGFTCE